MIWGYEDPMPYAEPMPYQEWQIKKLSIELEGLIDPEFNHSLEELLEIKENMLMDLEEQANLECKE